MRFVSRRRAASSKSNGRFVAPITRTWPPSFPQPSTCTRNSVFNLLAASFSPEIFEQVISTDGPFRSDTDGDGIADDIDQCPNTPLIEEADENGCGPSQKAYGLTIETEGNGRVIEEVINTGRTNTYDYGTRVKLTAEAEAGWAFKEWIGSVQSTENPLEYTVNSASTITAVFVDIDADDDGVMDADDLCPNSTAQMGLVDENGCALAQKDTDEDGVTDDIDKCNDTPAGETVNANGCHDYIYLAENGITIKATEFALVGDTKVINGKTYKVVDEGMLRQMVADDDDLESTVINFSTSSSAAGYGFNPTSYTLDILSGSWDFDQNGQADALTDGLLMLRHAFGLRGDQLTNGAVSGASPLTNEEVIASIESAYAFADIDGNGAVDALTDGLLLLRYLFGLRGDQLIAGAVSSSGSRQSGADVEGYLSSLMP